MNSLLVQRDLLATLKRETCSNVSILSKVYPLPNDLSRQIFKEDALEKPTQHTFLHLSYYLVQIIDAQKVSTFTWPLYDSKSEKIYRNELSSFIASYAASGTLAPVLSSYFVNPGCFKVTKLMFQLSHLALQQAVRDRMQNERQKALHKDAAAKYKSGSKDFLEHVEKETIAMTRRFQCYQEKNQIMTRMSELLKKKIIENEEMLAEVKKQKFLQDLVDDFVKNSSLEEVQKIEFEKIKEIGEPASFFDNWLQHVDDQIMQMESEWDSKMRPLLDMAQYCQETSQALILRHTGDMDKQMYMVEYDPQKDDIATRELENHVNPNQKYILKNIIKDDKLNFPNLIRGFVIAICFLLKTKDMDDDIYQINEYLEVQRKNFGEMVSALNVLLERVADADTQLQMSPVSICDQTLSIISEIPPLPDLSDLKATQTLQYQGIFDSFTPLNLSKHQFNLRRKANEPKFAKPLSRSLATPLHTSRNDFLKGLKSCKTYHERPKLNMSQNISIISQSINRGNETIAECSSGFTKQQIQRLLSTKKSSSKKHKFNPERPKLVIKKRGLFNESVESSSTLFRSHSSPNLFENKEKRPAFKRRGRKLSIMQEDAASLLEVSGIVALDSASNSGCHTPVETANSSRSQPLTYATSLPLITISPVEPCLQHRATHNFKENETDHIKNVFEELSREFLDDQTKLGKISEVTVPHKTLGSLIPVRITPTHSLHKLEQILKETEDLQQDFVPPHSKEYTTRKSIEIKNGTEENLFEEPQKSTDSISTGNEDDAATPKSNIPARKTSSIEKIINRFKKVRASVVPENRGNSETKFKPIFEEKENQNAVNTDVYTANRVLLPDLLSPSCSALAIQSSDFINLDTFGFELDDEKPGRKPRESLGTMLGVDQTFLDQFDLID